MQARRGQGAAYDEGVLCLTAPRRETQQQKGKARRTEACPYRFLTWKDTQLPKVLSS